MDELIEQLEKTYKILTDELIDKIVKENFPAGVTLGFMKQRIGVVISLLRGKEDAVRI